MQNFILQYWLECIFGAIVGVIGFYVKNVIKKQKAIENGVQALLRNELIKNFREHKLAGEITLLDKENMDHMFTEYFNLGGNGMMKDIYKEFQEIPIKIIKND